MRSAGEVSCPGGQAWVAAIKPLMENAVVDRRFRGDDRLLSLERDLDAMIQEWMALVDHDGELNCIPLSFEDRTRHLPNLIADLIHRLRLPQTEKATISIPARQHGDLRSQQGYSAAMLVEESRILQVSMFNTLQNNLDRVDFSKVLRDVITIADEVNSQLKQAILSYSTSGPGSAGVAA